MHNIKEIAQFTQQLATEAGELLLKAYQEQSGANNAKRTSPKEMKLVEDATIDEWLVQKILETYPTHSILAEESGEHKKGTDVLWIIDPIDGSVNFSVQNPFVAISLAVVINGELTIGVIEAPVLQEQFIAVKGKGAKLNKKEIHVSQTKKLSDAYLVSCEGGAKDRTAVLERIIVNYFDQVKDVRKLGSAALECAWVASGRADAYVTIEIDPWDVAAGILIVQEAGGKVTTFDNEAWEPKRADIICSNGLLHDELMSLL
ncbi:MAG: inositol monophosphatase family protein [bacterium]|nr:inositol monophosphatase family protein [bacterium]